MIDLAASLEAQATRQNAEGCVKITEDLDRYRAAIQRTTPGLIIECGTFSGKSAAWLVENSQAEVITIDTVPQIDVGTDDRWLGRVTLIQGNTLDRAISDQVKQRAEAHEKVMVILDSDHSTGHVLGELARYGPLVTIGCHCVVEDTIVEFMPNQGGYFGSPLEAADVWLKIHPDSWQVDEELEQMSQVTQHPGGWLLRTA